MESFKFQNDVPILKYYQKSLNSYCFSSLASEFDSINHNKAANDVSFSTEESLEIEVGKRIYFDNDILKKEKKHKGETKLHYKCPSTYILSGYNAP